MTGSSHLAAIDAVRDIVRSQPTVTVNLGRFSVRSEPSTLPFEGLTGIEEFSPEDQVVVVGTCITLEDLNAALESRGQCIPHKWPVEVGGMASPPIVELISLNLPHVFEGPCGTWRDWILGMRLVMADGTLVKSGSKAVKSVAGFDVHKLMIGARLTLAIPVEVTLRTYPLKSLPVRDVVGETTGGWFHWIQRVQKSDFNGALAQTGERLIASDPATSTIWAEVPPDESLPRYEGDWVIRSGCGENNLRFTDPSQIALMRRTKDLFDPTHKLNPGEMGVF